VTGKYRIQDEEKYEKLVKEEVMFLFCLLRVFTINLII